MATREKKKVITNVTQEQAQDASAAYTKAHVSLQSIEAKMNEEINKIKEKYQERITAQEDIKEAQFAVLEVYATEQKETWGKAKSIDMLHSRIGFRTGTPKLKLDRGWNWTSVTDILNENYSDYVRTVLEPNKEKLIADRELEGFDKICKKAHIAVVQDETFFVEPKVEEVATA